MALPIGGQHAVAPAAAVDGVLAAVSDEPDLTEAAAGAVHAGVAIPMSGTWDVVL